MASALIALGLLALAVVLFLIYTVLLELEKHDD